MCFYIINFSDIYLSLLFGLEINISLNLKYYLRFVLELLLLYLNKYNFIYSLYKYMFNNQTFICII